MGGSDSDEVAIRLGRLVEQLESRLSGFVSFTHDSAGPHLRATSMSPTEPGPLPVTWIDFGDALQLEAGHLGGRWELPREAAEAEFIADVAEAVVAGEVAEVFSWHRSRVEVNLRDGATAMETGSEGLRGVLPIPGWTRSGRRVSYPPYRFPDHRRFLVEHDSLTPLELAEVWVTIFEAVRSEATTMVLTLEWSATGDWPPEVTAAARRLENMAEYPDSHYTVAGPLPATDGDAWHAFTQVAPWCLDATVRADEAELVSLEPVSERGLGTVLLSPGQKSAIEQQIGSDRLVAHEGWLARKRRWEWLDFAQARKEDQARRSGADRILPHVSHRRSKGRQ